ncbi:ThiF family adenylyltransferase [Streptococcus pyogenes]
MYRLSDSIQIFENHDRKKIIIRNYGEGLVISIDRQNILIELFLFLKEYHTLEEIKSKFPTLSMDNIQEVVSYFLKLGILESQKVVNRKIKILLIGLGTTGSHIVESLSSLSCIEKLILVDSDKVSTTNLFRQSYSLQDLNEYKVDVFLNRKGRESYWNKGYYKV